MIWKKNDWVRELGKIVIKSGALDFCAPGEDLDNEGDYEPFVGVVFPKGMPESASRQKIAEMRRDAYELTGIVFHFERSKTGASRGRSPSSAQGPDRSRESDEEGRDSERD